ncbi:MAG TPA: hypothetical protein VFX39_07395, partial [Gemmatimonadaceae bacterium]|nr:hypothetical protein [Gemmatimonadaceae bacterium]
MRRISPAVLGAALAAATWLAGCADAGPVAPTIRPSLDLAAGDAPPDSAEAVVYPSDGPPRDAYGHRAYGIAGADAARPAGVGAPGPLIRIGVVQSATAITLGSDAEWVLRDRANGMRLLSGADGAVTVTLAQVAASHYRLQVMCGATAVVEARKGAAEALGHPTFTEFVPAASCTRLYIGQFAPPPANTFAARVAYKDLLVEQGLAGADAFWRVVTIGGGTVYRAEAGGTAVESVNPVYLESSDGIVHIGGANGSTSIRPLPFRGVGEARQSGPALAGINELPVEHYLYGVVPRELGPVQYPELEAQKAQ